MYGGWWTFPVPDIERTDLLVVMGANPAASQGSLLAAPDVMGIIDGIRKRGKVIVIDPVRTATAARADEWLPITPGTDAALSARRRPHAVRGGPGHARRSRTPHRRAGPDARGGRRMVAGAGGRCHQYRRRVASARWPVSWPPRRARWCTAGSARATRNSAAWRAGSSTSSTSCPATSTSKAAACSRGRRHGRSRSQPIPGLEDGAPEFGRFRTRVRGAKEVLGQVPVSCLAEEIATPGEGQIKALITVAGNPVLSTPAGHKLDEVLPTLDAMIAVDLWLNETTRHADVILPGSSPLEQPHHDDLILNFAINSIANYSAPVFARPDPDAPEEWEILIRLTGLCTGMPAEDVDVAAIDDGFFDYMALTKGLDGAEIRKHYDHGGPGTDPRLHAAHRTVRRSIRREPRRRDAGQTEGRAQRHQLRPDDPAGAGGARHLGRQDPAGAAVSARRPARLADAPGPGARGAGAGQPPASAVEQLVAAQRGAADEGQGPLHAADARRRREAAGGRSPAISSR